MKLLLLACILPCFMVSAEIPQKTPLHTTLWTNSPFTSKPPAENTITQASPLDRFILIGVAPVPGGHRITMTDKKDLNKRIILEPGVESALKVIRVNRNPSATLGTTVTLSDGNIQGDVRFEPALITPKSPVQTVQKPPLQSAVPPAITDQPSRAQTNPQQNPSPRITPPSNPTVRPNYSRDRTGRNR